MNCKYILFFFLSFFSFSFAYSQKDTSTQLQHIVIKKKSKRDWGREIMQKAIKHRKEVEKLYTKFDVNIYNFSKLDIEKIDSNATIFIRKSQLEWKSRSYIDHLKTKDIFQVYNDYSTKGGHELHGDPNIGTSMDVFGGGRIAPNLALRDNPYYFIKGINEAYFNLYQNYIEASHLSSKPIVSPLADNAFLFYRFEFVRSYDDKQWGTLNEIKVIPLFDYEPLLLGTILISEDKFDIAHFSGSINGKSLLFLKSLTFEIDYQKFDDRVLPSRILYDYITVDTRKLLLGKSTVYFSDYHFSEIDNTSNFWLETKIFDLDSSIHDFRPVNLNSEDLKFVHSKDSLRAYHNSKEYLDKQDDSINKIYFLDVVWSGVSLQNSYLKQRIWISDLISQLVPFGVGGYRHRLKVYYDKEFKNGNKISLQPIIDYGFYNKDLKGEIAFAYDFNPMKIRQFAFLAGDIYDYINTFQNISGTFGPANRVRNQKIGFSYRSEIVNGLFFKFSFDYSNRMSITNLHYPDWVNMFGIFSKPMPFDNYKVSILGLEMEYQPFQRYLIKNKRKIILESKWPLFGVKYSTGIPSLFGGQSNYGYIETTVSHQAKLAAMGNYQFRFVVGQFIYKKDLRLIEHKYFRTSDVWFLSNPLTSMQMLDTLLNTTNQYLQANFIHHFEGYFLNKIWLLNRLKLEETVGAGFLSLPKNHYTLGEVFAGVERKVKISKYLWKFGVFWTASVSSNRLGASHVKIGINFYDSFHKKWLY